MINRSGMFENETIQWHLDGLMIMTKLSRTLILSFHLKRDLGFYRHWTYVLLKKKKKRVNGMLLNKCVILLELFTVSRARGDSGYWYANPLEWHDNLISSQFHPTMALSVSDSLPSLAYLYCHVFFVQMQNMSGRNIQRTVQKILSVEQDKYFSNSRQIKAHTQRMENNSNSFFSSALCPDFMCKCSQIWSIST